MAKNSKYLPILSRENHEDWFRRARIKIKGKGIFYTVETSRTEYAWINREGGAAGTPATTDTTSSRTGEGDKGVENITSQFERIGGTWSLDKAKEWDQADARALEIILEGLGQDDAVLVDEYETAMAVWTQLKIKYEKTSATTANQYMTLMQNFAYDKSIGIDGSWTKLKEYRRKLVAANSEMRLAYPDGALLLILTIALRKEGHYSAILDGFLTQQTLSTEEKIKILGEKETQLKGTAKDERAHAAWRQHKAVYHHPNHPPRRNSNNSDTSMADVALECFCCGSTEHFVADCKYQAASREYARKLRLKDETPPSTKRRLDKKRGLRRGSKGKKTDKHSYTATHDPSLSSEAGTDDSHTSGNSDPEVENSGD
jgi:hypothetical protein